ncbi:MAG: arylamine N-acetyltransferase [Actinobacteria bacterium]|nr:arylamine N-acetyltransferase [Actinomycetota bacterium]
MKFVYNSNMDTFTKTYLERIGINDELPCNLESLARIQSQHSMTVPFENLNIALGIPIVFDLEALYDKIVIHRRGGICFELNLLLAELLRRLGFSVETFSARVRESGTDLDHVFNMATIDGKRWMVDVGFADNYFAPLPFELGTWTFDGRDRWKVEQAEGDRFNLIREEEGEEIVKYVFTLTERIPSDFRARCDYFETAPESHFKQGNLANLERRDGRVSLTDKRLLITTNGEKERVDIESREQFELYLREIFGIELPV